MFSLVVGEILVCCLASDIVRALWSTQDMDTVPVLRLMRKDEIVSGMGAQHLAKWSATAISLTAWTSIL